MYTRVAKVSGYFIDPEVDEKLSDFIERVENLTPIARHLHISSKDLELENDDPIFYGGCDLAYCDRFFSVGIPSERILNSRVVKPGEKYKHFKEGKIVTVIGVGQMSESPGSYMVIYHTEDPMDIWIRPYEMFVSPVDKLKYPKATQFYRFEKVEE